MVTRREFLQASAAAGTALAGLTACTGGGDKGKGTAQEPPIPVPSAPILVVVNIDGGYDWLNVMPPTAGANRSPYEALRPTLRIDAAATTDLGSGVGLNTDLSGLAELSSLGRIAWIPGIGMSNFSLSHFTAGDLWSQGANIPGGNGWLGRFADTAFAPAGDVLRGITVTSDLPLMLRGATRGFVSISNSSGYVFPAYLRGGKVASSTAHPAYSTTLLEDGWGTSLTTASPTGPSQGGYEAAMAMGKAFYDAQNDPAFGANNQLPTRTPTVAYPGDAAYPITRLDGGRLSSSLSSQLKLIAQMIASGLPGQIYYARLGGWDTHSNQATDHPNLQRALGGALRAFYDDLKSITTASGNAQDRVMIIGYSEFGRRAKENDGGTDHGTAGLAFAMGRAVRGGLYGAYPNLADLDTNGNMKYSAAADFRSLYATVLDRWLGQATATTNSLLGASYPRFGFL
ncbi:MAG TPA: DUF1501 domain-containing protein [Holophagaceae bacterium]|nr:DUF1501 domain-containing protein [Holophagaceae bacterium]